MQAFPAIRHEQPLVCAALCQSGSSTRVHDASADQQLSGLIKLFEHLLTGCWLLFTLAALIVCPSMCCCLAAEASPCKRSSLRAQCTACSTTLGDMPAATDPAAFCKQSADLYTA